MKNRINALLTLVAFATLMLVAVTSVRAQTSIEPAPVGAPSIQ